MIPYSAGAVPPRCPRVVVHRPISALSHRPRYAFPPAAAQPKALYLAMPPVHTSAGFPISLAHS